MMNYIDERMDKFISNNDEFYIGQIINDKDKSLQVISNKTQTSIEVFTKSKYKEGIDCKQWFTMEDFNRRFTINVEKILE